MTTTIGVRRDPSDVEAAPPAPPKRRRGRPKPLPYFLLLPSILVLGGVLGYPIVRLVILSTEKFGLRQQFGAPADKVGFANYKQVLTDPYFWTVLKRTLVFCAVNVVLTMVLGLAVSLLMKAVGKRMRLLVTGGLILAWAMPALVSTVVWEWIFDTQYGLINWLLGLVTGNDWTGHSWLSDPLSFYTVATIIVVWMGLPFVAFTLYAGLTQVPSEVMEAAAIDGAGPWRRFREVTVPYLKPLLLILTALSVLWDFRVFTQIYVLQRSGGVNSETNVLGIYSYRLAVGERHFDVGAAVAVVMIVVTLLLTLAYLRQMIRQDEI